MTNYQKRLKEAANKLMTEEYPAPLFEDMTAVNAAREFCKGADWGRADALVDVWTATEEIKWLRDYIHTYCIMISPTKSTKGEDAHELIVKKLDAVLNRFNTMKGG
jgi:hypothetical protein